MNQILITENDNSRIKDEKRINNHKEKKPTSIKSIVKTFAIMILFFGIAMVSTGAYAMVKNIEISQLDKKLVVEVIKKGDIANLSVNCELGIRTISYNWNNKTSKIIQGKGKNKIYEEIAIPKGTNQLNISVIDSKGQMKKFVKVLKQDLKDMTKPTIDFEIINSNVNIIAKDDKEIAYIEYQYGNKNIVRVEADSEGQFKIEKKLEVIQGENTIIVKAVDKANNVREITQKINGSKRPEATVEVDPNDPSYIIIKAKDEQGLRMVSYNINGQEYRTDPNTSLNTTTFEWRQKVKPGKTIILLHVYNINEQVTEFNGQYTY